MIVPSPRDLLAAVAHRGDRGATAVEYAVMLALILVACISIVGTLGTSIKGTFTAVNTGISGTTP